MRTAKSIVSVLLAAVLFMLAAASCGNDKQKTYDIEDFKVSDIQVISLGEGAFNFTVGVENTSSEDKTFDVGKFQLVLLKNNEIIPHLGGKTNCTAGKFEKFSFIIDTPRPELSVGDKVSVRYDDKEICEIKITKL